MYFSTIPKGTRVSVECPRKVKIEANIFLTNHHFTMNDKHFIIQGNLHKENMWTDTFILTIVNVQHFPGDTLVHSIQFMINCLV